MFCARDIALIDANPEAAVSPASRGSGREECRAHDLLCADHFSEEAKIEHLPGKTTVSISEGGRLGEHRYVSSNDEGVVGLEEEGGGGGGRKIAPAVGALLGRESVPGIAAQRLGGIGGVDNGEAIAEEAVPFGGGGCRGG